MERQIVNRTEDLDVDTVVKVLQIWDLGEFTEFVREKKIDGRKLLLENINPIEVADLKSLRILNLKTCKSYLLCNLQDVTEGIVKLWKPNINAKKFVLFVEECKLSPDKYLKILESKDVIKDVKIKTTPIECQYQTVTARRVREENMAPTTLTHVEDILKKIVPAKSFLYRNQQNRTEKSVPSYMPMDSTPKKPRRFFRLSSYEYPQFDLFSRTSKHESFDDRGYYSVKTNNRYFIQKTYKKQDLKTKYKSLPTPEEYNEKLPEDHFYEDLCYNDIQNSNSNTRNSNMNQTHQVHVKPCLVKIQELFQSFKMPFFRKHEMLENDKTADNIRTETASECNVYENSDSVSNMYDSVHAPRPVHDVNTAEKNQTKLPVEDYLEPVQLNKDYCDIMVKERDESLLGYIMSIFDNRFGTRRETNDGHVEDDADKGGCTTDGHKWERPRTNMADRPLPVPVENEPYFMNVDRSEAENLLMGLPDGAFILRPSSQPTHVYTLSVSCSGAVHNVCVRRRMDGRLALGFPRRSERSFACVTSLLRHHRRRRLLLLSAGRVVGATTLTETPHYYQTPSDRPVL